MLRAASARSIRPPTRLEICEIITAIKAAKTTAQSAEVTAGLTCVRIGNVALIQPLISAVAINTQFTAVMGAIRPVDTAPKCSGLRTNQASMPKLKPPRTSINFAHAIARTIAAQARGSQRSVALRRCTIRPIPIREKQRAVLGAIGIYLARTLASRSRPEHQPTNV